MSVTTDVTTATTDNTLTAQGRFSVRKPTLDLDEARKPLFAVAGVADLAIEQVKELPTLAQERVSEVPAAVKQLPKRVEQFRTEVEGYAKKASEQATDLYATLAVRGERLVTQIRRQPATEAAIAEGKEAVRKAEAAAVAAKKSVKAGEKAVEGAAAKIG
jgi:hypothetical protein